MIIFVWWMDKMNGTVNFHFFNDTLEDGVNFVYVVRDKFCETIFVDKQLDAEGIFKDIIILCKCGRQGQMGEERNASLGLAIGCEISR